MNYTSIDLGLTDYRQVYSLQKRCVALVKSKALEGFIIFTEHKPVFTLGRSAKLKNLLVDAGAAKSQGVDIVETDRGGDITFHGPGQLVIYPIFDLTTHYRDIHRYLRDIEEVAIRTLSEFNIFAFRFKERTGVWSEKGKIASIGIGISKWITYHGLAINANVDLRYFKMIYPCGFKDIKATSIKAVLEEEVDLSLLKNKLINHFSGIFNCAIRPSSSNDLFAGRLTAVSI